MSREKPSTFTDTGKIDKNQSSLASISQSISNGLKTVKNIVISVLQKSEENSEVNPSALESSKSQIDKIIDKGVAHYSSCACTDAYKGLSEDGFKRYMELSLREHDIPSDYKDMYLEYVTNVMKDNTSRSVHRRNIMFNTGSGSCASISLMSSRDDSNHFNLFVTSLQISCELGGEIFAYEDSVGQDSLLLPNVDRDKIHNLQKTSILSKEEFERIFVFLADVTRREMSTKLSIEAPPKNK